MKIFAYILLFIFVITSTATGQFNETNINKLPDFLGSRVRLQTESGATFQGILYSIDEEFIKIIDRDSQVITLVREAVKEARIIDPDLDKKSYYQDSAANRLLVMPTGFPMETGEFHIADQEIAAVTMSYGVNQNFSLWGGISIPGALVSARFITDIGEKSALSIGSFAGLSWIEFTGILIPYTVFSTGTPENNFTIGGGAMLGFDESSFDIDAAVLAVGGKSVLSDTTAIVTETWFIWGKMDDQPAGDIFGDGDIESEDEENAEVNVTSSWDWVPISAVPGIAFRIAAEKFSWDIGAVLPILIGKVDGKYKVEGIGGETGFIPIPLISLTYRID